MSFLRSVVMLFVPAVAFAQVDKTEVHAIVLSPSAAPVPALKYPLLPEVRDSKPGNAALLYQRAHSPEWWNAVPRDKEFWNVEFMEGRLDTFPRAEADKVLPRLSFLKEVDLAARRQYCDWEMVDRIRADGVATLLPDVQGFRTYGNLIGIRSRRLLLDRKFAEANHSMQTGLALARDVAEGPTLINALVGIAIASTSLTTVDDWIRLPGSPNLYWSLTDLPRPFISFRKGLQGERLMIDSLLSGAREALADPKKSMPSLPRDFRSLLEPFGNQPKAGDFGGMLVEAWLTVRLRKQASEYLIGLGRTQEQVDKLGPQQVAILYMVAQYDRYFDDIMKWSNLPYWEAAPGLKKAEEELREAKKRDPEGMLLAGELIPASSSVLRAQVRVDRRIALLRSFEAIRLYAAAHDGKLPKSWNDLIVPTPIDPGTGRPFDYRVEGDRVTLTVPRVPTIPPDADVLYEITIKK